MAHVSSDTFNQLPNSVFKNSACFSGISSSVSEALDKSVLVEETMFDEYEIEFNYSLIGKLDHYFATQGIHISLKDYAENIWNLKPLK